MSFPKYIGKRRITDTPAGDFVKDARADKELPDVKSWGELKIYLGRKGACLEAIDAARSVWRGYQKSLRAR